MGGSALEMIVSEMPVHPRRTQDPAIFLMKEPNA